jgi:F-type H+-transporting ATPase subunit b
VLIDWFTVAAQTLNFLILVWLMKRVLYRPIMNAIEARDKLVAAQLTDAAAREGSAQKAEEEFKRRNLEFDRDRAMLMGKAVEAARTENTRLTEAARVTAESLRNGQRVSLENEAADFTRASGRRISEGFFVLARRALRDLASTGLEEQVGAVFCRRLRAMNAADRSALGAAIDAVRDSVEIRSAFELPSSVRASLQIAIDETFGHPVALCFAVTSELIVGIELTAGGRRVGWSLDEYLQALQRSVGDGLPKTAIAAAT